MIFSVMNSSLKYLGFDGVLECTVCLTLIKSKCSEYTLKQLEATPLIALFALGLD